MRKSFSLEFLNCCEELSWVVNDGSKIVNIYLKDKMDSVEAWKALTEQVVQSECKLEKLSLPEDELDKLIPQSTISQIDFG